MEIITGYTGKPHVTSEQDRDVNIGVVGEGSYVLQTGMQLAAEVSSNNEIKIRDGVLIHQGCTASIKKNTYDSLTITNGSQGMKRVDLIVARYEKNQGNRIESLDLKVIQGTPAESNPAAPQYTEGDIQAGDYVADMPLYQVLIDGLNIVNVTAMFDAIGNISQIAKTNKDLSKRIAESFKCELTQLTAKAFRAAPKATAMRLDEQYDYSDFKMIGFCVINMSTSDSVTHRQWQWLPTQWLQDNLLNQSSSSSYANRRLIFNFSRGGGGQRAWIYGSTNDGLNFIKGSYDTDNYDCVIFGLR